MDSERKDFLVGDDRRFVLSEVHIKHTLEDVWAKRQGENHAITTDREVVLDKIEGGGGKYNVGDGVFMLSGTPPKAYAYFNSHSNKLSFFDTDGEYKYTFEYISGVVEDVKNSHWSTPSPDGNRDEDYSLFRRPPVEIRNSGHPHTAVYHWDDQWAKVGLDVVDNVFASTPREGWEAIEDRNLLEEKHHKYTQLLESATDSVKIELDGVPTEEHNNLDIGQENVTIQAILTAEKAIDLYDQLGEAISEGVSNNTLDEETANELRSSAEDAERKFTSEPSDPDST